MINTSAPSSFSPARLQDLAADSINHSGARRSALVAQLPRRLQESTDSRWDDSPSHQRNHRNLTPLMERVFSPHYDHAGFVDYLAGEGGASVNDVCVRGVLTGGSALQFAIDEKNTDAVRALLEAGADPNILCEAGQLSYCNRPGRPCFTPLTIAAAGGNAAIVELLLQNGADRDFGSGPSMGKTALGWAIDQGQSKAAAVLQAAGASERFGVRLDDSEARSYFESIVANKGIQRPGSMELNRRLGRTASPQA